MSKKNRWICLSFLLFPYYLLALAVSDLTLEEKVGQVLMVHIQGKELTEEAASLILENYIGGVIYYRWANGLESYQQVQDLSRSLQRTAKKTPHAIPLMIAIDQEGGSVKRLKEGFTVFPGNYALGETEHWQWGKESAYMVGKELKAVGISLNLAPVVDIYTSPMNPVIGIRSFSKDPFKVARWGSLAIQGYQEAGIIPALKHFPGHGDVVVDSHEALPIIPKKREELDEVELVPFRMLASQADVIMTAHLLLPELDPHQCVTFSRKIVHDLLRQELKFSGVIMTDSFAMRGVLSQCSSVPEGVLKSLQAGHDCILLGGKLLNNLKEEVEFTPEDIKGVHRFLVDAVKQGRLCEKCLDESVARLLFLKEKYGLFNSSLSEFPLQNDGEIASHRALAYQIAERALHLVHGENLLPLSFQSKSLLIIAPDSLEEEIAQTSWNYLGTDVQVVYFKGSDPDHLTLHSIKESASKADICLYFLGNAWKCPAQRNLFREIKKTVPTTLVIAVRDLPLEDEDLNSTSLLLCTFSPVACSLQAAFDFLTGKSL